MQYKDIYRQLTLENGLQIVIVDLSRNYFGDYCHVRLEICCALSRDEGMSGADTAVMRRIVEKMGVPSAEVEAAKESLVKDFLNNSISYLSLPDFPKRLSVACSVRQGKAFVGYGRG